MDLSGKIVGNILGKKPKKDKKSCNDELVNTPENLAKI